MELGPLEALRKEKRMNYLEWTMYALSTVTGAIHLYAGTVFRSPILVLAGLGFIGGQLAFIWFKRYRPLIAAAAIPYTAVQVVRYFQLYGTDLTGVGILDKLAQTAFIALSAYYVWRNKGYLEFSRPSV